MRAALDEAQARQGDFTASLATKNTLSSAVTLADSNAKSFIGTARLVLVPMLGSAWSQEWAPTGFPNQSTAVPTTIAERQALLESLQRYFANNAAHENAPLNVTATRAAQLFAALSAARSALNAHLTANTQKKSARDNAETALRKRMRGLIDELGQLLPDDDARWYGFGLNPPAAPDTPAVPDEAVLTSPSAGIVLADWPDVPRATRYRVWKMIVGTDADFVAAATVTDSDATLTVPSGATVRVRLSAANEHGESQPGPATEIAVG